MEDVLTRRIFAYLIDLFILALIGFVVKSVLWTLTILSLGLLGFLFGLVPALGTIYTALTVGGPGSATLGMRLMSIEVRRIDGGRPDFVQALIFGLLFYVTIALTSWLILLVALFTRGHRALHDLLSGLVIVPSGAVYRR